MIRRTWFNRRIWLKPTWRSIGAGLAGAAVCLQAGTALAGPQQQSSSGAPQRALLDRYCVTCHNDQLKTGELSLAQIDVAEVGAGADVWEKVIRKLRAGLMPPTGRPRPDEATVANLISYLETAIDREASAAPNPGRPLIHRLNRVEYTNAIRDLLALEIDGPSLLPGDAGGYGFDNIADVLNMSSGLLERYLLAAQKISRRAIGDPTIPPVIERYALPYLTLLQDERMGDDLPAGSRGGIAFPHHFALDGEYELRVRLQTNALALGSRIRGLDIREQIDVRLDGRRIELFTLGGEPRSGGDGYEPGYGKADDALVVRFPVEAGTRLVGVAFQERNWAPEGVGPSRLPAASFGFSAGAGSAQNYGRIEMTVDYVEIAGPFDGSVPQDTPSRRKIFVCRPAQGQDEEPCARTILSTLARQAYRRPVTAGDVDELVGFFQAGRREGNFETGIQWALERLLTGPEFLFRIERDPADAPVGTVHRVSDLELAARLSFFLWSTIPDEELLDLAARHQLRDPAVLNQQVRRMLADPRFEALRRNFFGQWLHLRNLKQVAPDPQAYPDFDDNLRAAFERETELFLASQFGEDRSALDLLTANYTFVNERLARHYGIPNVYGSHFRRVTFSDDRRAGILGQGSILTVTSYANRTSPVERGKWLMENILGTPPPAPPPSVPPLPENDDEGVTPTSVRERMEQHRRNPVCAACHNQIDPLGFALENFDGIGRWRTTEANTPIDPSGAFPSGDAFASPAEFRQVLVSRHQDGFLGILVEKLLTYALGRGVEYTDMPAVRQILRTAAEDDYRWSSLMLSIVQSTPFQMRASEAPGSESSQAQ